MNSYTHWNITMLSSLPWRKSSTKYVFNSFLKLFKFTFGQSNDLILWKSVFLNSSYLSQLNKKILWKIHTNTSSQKPLQKFITKLCMGSYCGLLYKIVVSIGNALEHDLAKNPASPKLLGIWKNYMMHELSFSAHHFRLVRVIRKIVKKTFHHY